MVRFLYMLVYACFVTRLVPECQPTNTYAYVRHTVGVLCENNAIFNITNT